jgi:hypothetical protein
LTALSLAGIDIYYALMGRISNIYFLDALTEICFVIGWTLVIFFTHNSKPVLLLTIRLFYALKLLNTHPNSTEFVLNMNINERI